MALLGEAPPFPPKLRLLFDFSYDLLMMLLLPPSPPPPLGRLMTTDSEYLNRERTFFAAVLGLRAPPSEVGVALTTMNEYIYDAVYDTPMII